MVSLGRRLPKSKQTGLVTQFLITKKYVESTSKEVKRKEIRQKYLVGPRRIKACNTSFTTLLQGITKIGTQRTTMNHRKALHELTTHIHPQEIDGRE
jgi:hypothetical protein